MVSPVLQRHPKLLVTCCLGLLCLLLLGSSGGESRVDRLSKLYPKAASSYNDVAWRLRRSEVAYQKTLRDRDILIRKFGPTRRDVLAWPKNREFYTLWDFFAPAFNCPQEMERVGALADGGKYVCGLSRLAEKKGCVIYSFGLYDESSFEAALLERTRYCEVWGYDAKLNDFGPEIRNSTYYRSRSHFKKWKLAPEVDSASSKPPAYTIGSLMKMNGHKFIDILTLEVDGTEFLALKTLIAQYRAIGKPLPIGQLQVEIHADKQPGIDNTAASEKRAFPQFLEWWEDLEAAGLRPFSSEPNLIYVNINLGARPALSQYSFLNIKADHDILYQ